MNEQPSLHLTRDESTTIGFVVACLFGEAIDKSELQAWANHVLVSTDNCPPYVVELSTFDGALFELYKMIGFAPHCELSDAERRTLTGIAYWRGRSPYETLPKKEEALELLKVHPGVLARFRATFPFIALP